MSYSKMATDHQAHDYGQQFHYGDHHLNCSYNRCDQNFSSSLSLYKTSSLVQSLNNRACVMVAIGKFSKANDLLEIALTKHREMTALLKGASCTWSHRGQSPADNGCIDGDHDNDLTMMDAYDEFGYYDQSDYDTSESSFDDDYDDDQDMLQSTGSGSSIQCDQRNQRKNTTIPTPYSIPVSGPSTPSPSMEDRFLPVSAQIAGFSRLSSCPQVQTFPYSGQQVDRPPCKWLHHKIYSMPIVMDDCEWKEAPMDDRTFILIFNSALSNHMLGIQRLMRYQLFQGPQIFHHHHHRNAANDFIEMADFRTPFEVAKKLYKLGLEVFSGAPTTFVGVDRLCYPAVFNNLSHVCKVLDGYDSQDSYNYDMFLIKSIYWMIDSRQPISPNQQGLEVSHLYTNSIATAPSFARSSRNTQINYSTTANTINYTEKNPYDDADDEILEAFLENVFYLIGTSQSTAPAAAA